MKHGALRVRTGMPDFLELEGTPEPDWAYSVYGSVTEEIPSDIPEPLGKEVVLWAHTLMPTCSTVWSQEELVAHYYYGPIRR